MPMSEEQVIQFHEKYGESLRQKYEIQEALGSIREQYRKGVNLAYRILLSIERWDEYNDDAPKCEHCGKDLI